MKLKMPICYPPSWEREVWTLRHRVSLWVFLSTLLWRLKSPQTLARVNSIGVSCLWPVWASGRMVMGWKPRYTIAGLLPRTVRPLRSGRKSLTKGSLLQACLQPSPSARRGCRWVWGSLGHFTSPHPLYEKEKPVSFFILSIFKPFYLLL